MNTVASTWRVRWKNFRGYSDSSDISFPAMTLLIGRNNAGKSSAYAPLLLLRQTLDARNAETALLFRGQLVDFGTYEDVVTDHDTSREMSMELSLGNMHMPIFDTPGREVPATLTVTFADTGDHTAKLVSSTVLSPTGARLVDRRIAKDKAGEYKVASPLLPRNTDVGRPLKEVSALRQHLQQESPNGFLFSGIAGIRIPRSYRQDEDRWAKVRKWYQASSNIYDLYYQVNTQVEKALRGIAYIGPLRSSPQRSYLLSAEAPIDVGRDGQWASEVLYRSSLHGDPSGVLSRTNLWLQRLGYGTLSFYDAGNYFQVRVSTRATGVRVNLADCGVGLSQLLPLLVQGCVLDPEDTLVAQQPEIHLNPAQQDIMTDFLIELSATGRRVIIETHSEHILGRLRRRIAEGETLKGDDVALYFSEASEDRSHLRRIGIGQWGEVAPEEWPEGFFNEQLQNAMQMSRALAMRRRTNDNNTQE